MTTIDGNEVLQANCSGLSYRQIGDELGISHEQARQMALSALDTIVLDAVTAMVRERAAQDAGQDPATIPTFIISVPYGPDFQMGQALVHRVTDRLRTQHPLVRFRVDLTQVPPGTLDYFDQPSPGGLVYHLTLDPDHDSAAAGGE